MATTAQTRKKPSEKPTEKENITANPAPSKRSQVRLTPQDIFLSGFTKAVVLLMMMTFNVIILKNSFLLVAPKQGFSGNIAVDALLYGMGISVLMVIILFQEEHWENRLCPGSVTLYLDAFIMMLYMRWFDAFIGISRSLWLLSGLLTFLPVLGLFILVVMLKKAP
jgi:hypothetical protein